MLGCECKAANRRLSGYDIAALKGGRSEGGAKAPERRFSALSLRLPFKAATASKQNRDSPRQGGEVVGR